MFKETKFGYELETNEFIIFFGNKNCDIEFLKKQYPQIEFRGVKQTHSDRTVVSQKNSHQEEADAHYTADKQVGLIIKTADCIPLMVFDRESKKAVSIHAGWKGVENQITFKSLKEANLSQNLVVYFGPHIMQNSFQVDTDVNDQLLKSAKHDDGNFSYYKEGKYWVNLKKIVESQIYSYASKAEILSLDVDTYTDERFNSFRKDKTAFRNLSFIALKQ